MVSIVEQNLRICSLLSILHWYVTLFSVTLLSLEWPFSPPSYTSYVVAVLILCNTLLAEYENTLSPTTAAKVSSVHHVRLSMACIAMACDATGWQKLLWRLECHCSGGASEGKIESNRNDYTIAGTMSVMLLLVKHCVTVSKTLCYC